MRTRLFVLCMTYDENAYGAQNSQYAKSLQ